MIVSIEPRQRPDGDVGVEGGGPEKGFRIVGAVGNPPARDEAVGQPSARPDHDVVPDGASVERGSGPDPATVLA